MKKIILLLSLFFAVQYVSHAQENCCPDVDVEATVFGCKIRICFVPADGGEFCEGDINFLALIHDESGQIVASESVDGCFTWKDAIPGVTYTIGAKVDYPFECDTGNEVNSDVVTVPEQCADCEVRCINVQIQNTLNNGSDYDLCQDENQIAAVTRCKSQDPFDFPFPTNFNWEGSDGSTSNTPFIVMSPGVEYCVTVTDPIGCEYVECIDYECEVEPEECTTPEGFGCYGWGDSHNPTIGIGWAEVPGATSYQVQITNSAPGVDCCDGFPNFPGLITQTNNYISDIEAVTDLDCFVVRVVANCADGTVSPPTEWICINSESNCPFRTFAPDDDNQLNRSRNISDLQIAPNPTSGIIHLSGGNLVQGSIISIYDLQGRIVLNEKIETKNQLSLSLENLNPAIYVLIIRDQNGMIVEEAKISKM